MKIFIILFLISLLIFDIKISLSTSSNREYTFEYNGLIWVVFDYYSIHTYKSNDKPIKWFDYKSSIIYLKMVDKC